MSFGYKAFDKNLKCREFQFKVGKTYKHDGDIVPCKSGFHFCKFFFGVYQYYNSNKDTRICFVESMGKEMDEGNKTVANELRIIRELSLDEIIAITENFHNNSGHYNSGNRNSGDYNSGHYNSGNRNSGICNTQEGNIYIFDTLQKDLTYSSKIVNDLLTILNRYNKPIVEWIDETEMTDKEKLDYPTFKTTGGYLKQNNEITINEVTKEDELFLRRIEGFSEEKLLKCTGIDLTKKLVKVIIEGQEIMVTREVIEQWKKGV